MVYHIDELSKTIPYDVFFCRIPNPTVSHHFPLLKVDLGIPYAPFFKHTHIIQRNLLCMLAYHPCSAIVGRRHSLVHSDSSYDIREWAEEGNALCDQLDRS